MKHITDILENKIRPNKEVSAGYCLNGSTLLIFYRTRSDQIRRSLQTTSYMVKREGNKDGKLFLYHPQDTQLVHHGKPPTISWEWNSCNMT